MTTYFEQADIDAAVEQKVNELGETLEQRITTFTESISEQLSTLSSQVQSLEEKLAGLE